ncbi:hypothetical protein SeMB42_g02378 [Synchytrium endobioticum]|uniref:Uncharacterized protein n=1 Tax=Synchytrium endobioticum TaxID=286115 RepID=A0A507DFF5_9FUNG|nr:hypothetical protein SeLEV6574_g02679 [Synchytrium endobioticum]TPX50075.1 hypothetical protein SeMB42_g02378 [Synchytrium endobioticum]
MWNHVAPPPPTSTTSLYDAGLVAARLCTPRSGQQCNVAATSIRRNRECEDTLQSGSTCTTARPLLPDSIDCLPSNLFAIKAARPNTSVGLQSAMPCVQPKRTRTSSRAIL